MTRISKRTIDALASAAAGTVLRDEEIKGFQARLNANGSITYCYEYRAGSGRTAPVRRLSIGKVGSLTPDDARKLAKDHAASVAKGEDPAGDKSKAKKIPTLFEFATSFLDKAEKVATNSPENAKLRIRSIANYRSLLKRHLGPAFGNRRLDLINRSDVSKLHATMGEAKPMTANRALELVGTIYREAWIAGHVSKGTNPASDIAAYRENRRERFLTSQEYDRLGDAILLAETTGIPYSPPQDRPGKKTKHVPKSMPPYVIDKPTAGALRLLIFTGARLREILHAKWADFDAEHATLAVFGKTGLRPIYLPAPALEVIASLPKSGPYLIAATDPKKPKSDLARPWKAISKIAGLEGVRLHDLRHSFASSLVSGGASLPMIGKLLGHTQPQTTARYAHLADDPVRAAAERAAGSIAGAMSRKTAEVVAFSVKRNAK